MKKLRDGVTTSKSRALDADLIIRDDDGLHDLQVAGGVLRRLMSARGGLHHDGWQREISPVSLPEGLHEHHQAGLVPALTHTRHQTQGRRRCRMMIHTMVLDC